MSSIIQTFLKLVIAICFLVGTGLLIYKREQRIIVSKKIEQENKNPKAILLKKYLIGFKKPTRVEIYNYTKKFDADVNQILEMKIPTDPNSDFYITIQFFTDESDEKAPLVAQVRFLDSKTDNLVREESINLN